jgi:hypothetical protein
MVACLRRELLYSEKRARDFLFRAVRRILEDRAGALIVSRLAREAASSARQEAEAAGFSFDHWEAASRALVKAMLGAGVLRAPGGGSIRDGITAQAEIAGALHERFEDLTEAYLLEFLIRRMGDITIRDHMALAHALFRQFDRGVPIEDLEDRVVILLASLVDRVRLQDGRYQVNDSAADWDVRSGP